MLCLLFKGNNTSAKLHSSINMRKSSTNIPFFLSYHLQYTFQEHKITAVLLKAKGRPLAPTPVGIVVF